mmetsp:Transcript_1575/g.3595  ORF Transcript_1575/g.3595 Transcript_1575/m.3595 type:complete len:201 (+) Transcript_1575:224-826(+)
MDWRCSMPDSVNQRRGAHMLQFMNCAAQSMDCLDALHAVPVAHLLPDHELHDRKRPEAHPLRCEAPVEAHHPVLSDALHGAVDHARVQALAGGLVHEPRAHQVDRAGCGCDGDAGDHGGDEVELDAVVHDAVVDELVLDVVVGRELRRVEDGSADHGRVHATVERQQPPVRVHFFGVGHHGAAHALRRLHPHLEHVCRVR